MLRALLLLALGVTVFGGGVMDPYLVRLRCSAFGPMYEHRRCPAR
jgi:hypothetical protein